MKQLIIITLSIMVITLLIFSCKESSSSNEDETYEARGTFSYNTETDTLAFNVTSSNFDATCGPQVGTITVIVPLLSDTSAVIYFPDESAYEIWIRNDNDDGAICGEWKLYINGQEALKLIFTCSDSSTEIIYTGDFVLSGDCINPKQVNNPPVINTLVANPSALLPGETSSLSCNASDPDGDELIYTWNVDHGLINGAGNAVSWNAPDSSGTFLITCTVSDEHGGKVTEGINISIISLIGTWQTGTPLPAGRAAHTCVAYNGYMYVTGGTDGSQDLNDVLFAPINEDGILGEWITTTSFEQGRSNHTSFIQNGYLYLLGGWDPVVKYAQISEVDGTIGEWDSTTAILSERLAHSSVVYNDYLYVLGGYTGGYKIGLNDVLYTGINGDGTLGSSWNNANSFADGRFDHSSVVYNGYIYIIGGDNGDAFYNDVQYAYINPDGTVGTWNPTTSLPENHGAHTSFVYNGYLFVTGGYSDQIIFARINPDGSIGNWVTSPRSYSGRRGNHTSIIYNDYLYIIGGGGGEGTLYNDVQYAPLLGID